MSEAARLIKPGGTIFYATPSFDPAENDEIIQYAVDVFDLTVEKQEFLFGSEAISVFPNSKNMQVFFPDKHDTQGYFIAKLTK